MRGRNLTLVSLIPILLFATMAALVKAPAATTVYVDPPEGTAPIGDTYTIDINIDAVEGLSSWEVKLTWDSTILYTDYSMITEGDFLSQGGAYMTFFAVSLTPEPPAPPSQAIIGCMLLEPITTSGSGTLATVTFTVTSEGETPLDLFDTSLFDIDLNPIPHTAEDGHFNNIVIGNLVRKSAWPEHHHFSISKDEDGIQTVYGKVKNLGGGYGFIRVRFQVWQMDGAPMEVEAKYMVGDVETRIAPGEIVNLSVKLWETRETAWTPGKYYVSAQALFSADGTAWEFGEKVKSFSFAIVS